MLTDPEVLGPLLQDLVSASMTEEYAEEYAELYTAQFRVLVPSLEDA